jgi:hypothetical protein
VVLLFAGGAELLAQEKPPADWDTTKPRGAIREIDFETSEGTWMSLDLSPDGKWIVFDLLGHIFRVSAAGGKAECLTEDAGIAINITPRYSRMERALRSFPTARARTISGLWMPTGRIPALCSPKKDSAC